VRKASLLHPYSGSEIREKLNEWEDFYSSFRPYFTLLANRCMRKPATKTAAIMAPMSHQLTLANGVGAGGVGDAVGIGFSVGDGVGNGGGGAPPLVLTESYVTEPKLWDEGIKVVIFIHPITGGRLTSALISSPTTL